MKRLEFIATGLLSLPVYFLDGSLASNQSKDPLPDKLVNEFVRAGHNDLDAVKQMLNEKPALLNASWDWGNGDFETALGGASHMGNRGIATYLLAQGARADIFTYAMLGHVQIVRGMAELYPSLLTSKGPHGISLYTHALKGGEEATDIIKYLEASGITK